MCCFMHFSRAPFLRSADKCDAPGGQSLDQPACAFSRVGREQYIFIIEIHYAAVHLQLYFAFPNVVFFALSASRDGLW